MGYEGGEFYSHKLAEKVAKIFVFGLHGLGNIFKRLCAGLKSREKYSFFGLEGSVIDGL